MTHAEIDALIADVAGITLRHAETVRNRLFRTLADAAALGETVRLPEIGTLSRRLRRGGSGRNPRTGAAIDIAARYKLHLSPAKAMRARLASLAPPLPAPAPPARAAE